MTAPPERSHGLIARWSLAAYALWKIMEAQGNYDLFEFSDERCRGCLPLETRLDA